MKTDTIEKIDNTILQHGKLSDRVYLMHLDDNHRDTIIGTLDTLAAKHNYSKIFAKVPFNMEEIFSAAGYTKEAYIPHYYKGKDTCVFMCKYLKKTRAKYKVRELSKVIKVAKSKMVGTSLLSAKYELKKLTHENAEEIAVLYREVFESYPFPIFEPEYIEMTAKDNIVYFGIFESGKLVAASSAETNPHELNAEMTDFAVLPAHRGEDLASVLLDYMEAEMRKAGYITFYTIARSVSYGMNCTFAKAGYNYTGTLINNTNIGGSIESMNVWYKSFADLKY